MDPALAEVRERLAKARHDDDCGCSDGWGGGGCPGMEHYREQIDVLLPLIAAERDEAAREARDEVVARVERVIGFCAAHANCGHDLCGEKTGEAFGDAIRWLRAALTEAGGAS